MRHEVLPQGRVRLCHRERPSSIAAMLEIAADDSPDSEALVSGDTRLSWRELRDAVASLAGGLIDTGLAAGDRVAICMGNRLEYVLLVLASGWIGCPVVPIGERETRDGICNLLETSGATGFFYEAGTAAASVEATDQWFAIDVDSQRFGSLRGGRWTKRAETASKTPAAIMFTSGTTGRPKGAILTNEGVVHASLNYVRTMQLGRNDRSLLVVPMSHVTGLVALLTTAVCARMTLVLMRKFDPETTLEVMAHEAITHTVMVPAMYNLMMLRADLKPERLASWRIGGYGGAPMPEAQIERLAALLPNLGLMNLYGATETTSPAVIMPSRHALDHCAAVGIPAPGIDIAVMDDRGIEVPGGTPGELWIRGASVVPGYWGNEEATKKEFSDGYWKSGDIGMIDTHGFVRLLGRTKDMINRGGYKIFADEVEALLAELPFVEESAVVGRPCEVLGERVHAVVVVRDGFPLPQPSDLWAHIAKRLADFKVPETWDITRERLARNANGKVLKRELRENLKPYVKQSPGAS